MPFETYVPKRGPKKTGPSAIKILKNGDLSINPSAVGDFFKGVQYVELLYDSKGERIGLRPKRRATKATYKLRESPQGGDRRYVSAGKFLDHFGITVKKAQT